jgi:molybdopterin/thiamine biosynthesis adenylyltransferase
VSHRRYTLTLPGQHFEELGRAFVHPGGHERAAFLFCSRCETERETRLIVREVARVPEEHIRSSSPVHVSISSAAYVPAIGKADARGLSFVLVHNHPTGFPEFSVQDDREERELFRTAFIRAPNGPHGSLIFVGGDTPNVIGRAWLDESTQVPLERIRVVGRRMRVFDRGRAASAVATWADRQVRAFGPDTQALLTNLHVGVVGAGGTGSSVCEQLLRLGVGELTVVDEQTLSDTNVTRVYGSGLADEGMRKVDITRRLATHISLGTKVNTIHGSVSDEKVARALRDCDVIFCCTDDYLGRVILNRIAVWYHVPVIDLAVAIDSADGVIREITGRVTTLLPGNACLRCRGRIPQKKLDADMLKRHNPEEHAGRVREGYAPELGTPDPAVVMFTTGVASRAVSEFLQLLTGYMGDDRTATEILERFHETAIRVNSVAGLEGCFCVAPAKWGCGDQRRFLDLNW